LSHTKRITIGFLETFEALGQTLARNSQDLLEYYKLIKKISTYVKEEKLNLNNITISLKSTINCETLGEMKSS
jgi:hypothetical protein